MQNESFLILLFLIKIIVGMKKKTFIIKKNFHLDAPILENVIN